MIKSRPYTIPRATLARLTGFYYLRTFWFALLPPFLFGLALLLFGPNKLSQVFGVVLAAWPFTVFLRAFLLHRKVHEAWLHPTEMTVGDDAFLFESNEGSGRRVRLRFESVRRVIPMMGYQLLQTKKLGFVPVPDNALPEGTNLRIFVRSSL